MNTRILKPGPRPVIGLLLTLPTAYFILISLFKYAFGWPALFDTAQPLLESWGIQDSPGWNINLLILFGPLVAFFLNLSRILSISRTVSKTDVQVHLNIRKYSGSWVVVAISALCLLAIFAYGFGENCNC